MPSVDLIALQNVVVFSSSVTHKRAAKLVFLIAKKSSTLHLLDVLAL